MDQMNSKLKQTGHTIMDDDIKPSLRKMELKSTEALRDSFIDFDFGNIPISQTARFLDDYTPPTLRKSLVLHTATISEDNGDHEIGMDEKVSPPASTTSINSKDANKSPHDQKKRRVVQEENINQFDVQDDANVSQTDVPYYLANHLLSKHIIEASAPEGVLYIYDDHLGYYRRHDMSTFPIWLQDTLRCHPLASKVNTHATREVFARLLANPDRQTRLEDFDHEEMLLNVLNGVVDLETGDLLDHSPEYRFTNVIQAKYKQNSKKPPQMFLDMLEHLFQDKDDRLLFLESYAYLLSNISTAKVCFYYYGAPHTGKSVLLRLLTMLIGREFVSTLPIDKFSDRFAITTLYGMKINICGEHEGARRLERTSVLKSIIGGDWIDAEPKGRPHFKYRARAKCVFASNVMLEVNPKIAEEALFTRFIFVAFQNPIQKADRIADFDEVLFSEERNSILKFLVDILRQWIIHGRTFTQSAMSKKLRKQFMGQKSSVKEFVEEYCDMDKSAHTLRLELYHSYEHFCESNCMEKLTPVCFIKEFMRIYPMLGKTKIRSNGGTPLWCVKGIILRQHKA